MNFFGFNIFIIDTQDTDLQFYKLWSLHAGLCLEKINSTEEYHNSRSHLTIVFKFPVEN